MRGVFPLVYGWKSSRLAWGRVVPVAGGMPSGGADGADGRPGKGRRPEGNDEGKQHTFGHEKALRKGGLISSDQGYG